MRLLIFTITLMINLSIYGQDSFQIGDSINFDITGLSNIISAHPGSQLPDTISLDIDENGETDIRFRALREYGPQTDFNNIYYFYLDNYLEDQFEILSSTCNSDINLYRYTDTAEVKIDTFWKSFNTYPLYYEQPGLAYWHGMDIKEWPLEDSIIINNVYMAFRLISDEGISHGWLKFSGVHLAPKLFLHEVAISKEKTTTPSIKVENQLDINLYPNPTDNILQIDLKNIADRNLEWSLYDMSMHQINKGFLANKITTIDLTQSNLQKGLYFLQIKQEGVLRNTHQIIKI